MAKNHYLPKLLFIAALLLCSGFSSAGLINNVIANRGRDSGNRSEAIFNKNCSQLPTREKVSKICTAEIGIRELTGHNDGKRVEEYLRYCKLGKGNPWCAAFVCWVYGKAGVINPRSAWSPDLFPGNRLVWSRSRAIRFGTSIPSIPNSSIFSICFSDKGRIAHTGFIDHREGNWLVTVEGNTNIDGSRDGNGVYRKRRLSTTIYSIADWIDAKPGAGPG